VPDFSVIGQSFLTSFINLSHKFLAADLSYDLLRVVRAKPCNAKACIICRPPKNGGLWIPIVVRLSQGFAALRPGLLCGARPKAAGW
jgi:hypothetical protein